MSDKNHYIHKKKSPFSTLSAMPKFSTDPASKVQFILELNNFLRIKNPHGAQ